MAKDLDEAELGGPITWEAPADPGLCELKAAMFGPRLVVPRVFSCRVAGRCRAEP